MLVSIYNFYGFTPLHPSHFHIYNGDEDIILEGGLSYEREKDENILVE